MFFLRDGIERRALRLKVLSFKSKYRIITNITRRVGIIGKANTVPIICFVIIGSRRKSTGMPRYRSVNSAIKRDLYLLLLLSIMRYVQVFYFLVLSASLFSEPLNNPPTKPPTALAASPTALTVAPAVSPITSVAPNAKSLAATITPLPIE